MNVLACDLLSDVRYLRELCARAASEFGPKICLLVLQVTFEQRGGIKRLKHLRVSSFGLRTDSDAEEVLYAFQFADAFERFTGSHFTVLAEPWGPTFLKSS